MIEINADDVSSSMPWITLVSYLNLIVAFDALMETLTIESTQSRFHGVGRSNDPAG